MHGPFACSVADFLYGHVWAASLITAVFALRERIGERFVPDESGAVCFFRCGLCIFGCCLYSICQPPLPSYITQVTACGRFNAIKVVTL